MARTTSICLAVALLASVANGKKICSPALEALSGSDFSTLAAALTEAVGPLDAFDGLPEKSIIVAPNNEAFDTALTGLGLTPAELLGNKELLTKVLYGHIGQVADDGSITDLNGNAMMVMVDGKEVPLTDAATAETVTISDANGIDPVTASTPIACFGGDQLVFPSTAVILPKAEEEKTPGGETAREDIEEASGATSLAAGAVAAAMGLVATMF